MNTHQCPYSLHPLTLTVAAHCDLHYSLRCCGVSRCFLFYSRLLASVVPCVAIYACQRGCWRGMCPASASPPTGRWCPKVAATPAGWSAPPCRRLAARSATRLTETVMYSAVVRGARLGRGAWLARHVHARAGRVHASVCSTQPPPGQQATAGRVTAAQTLFRKEVIMHSRRKTEDEAENKPPILLLFYHVAHRPAP